MIEKIKLVCIKKAHDTNCFTSPELIQKDHKFFAIRNPIREKESFIIFNNFGFIVGDIDKDNLDYYFENFCCDDKTCPCNF